MEILVLRKWFTNTSTVSEVYFDDKLQGYILEDTDRGLDASMPLTQLLAKKIHSITAIPSGHYEMAITYSDRFKKYLPLLLNVPGYIGIRWHVGNYSTDTDGCQLVGLGRENNEVSSSRDALTKWLPVLEKATKVGKVIVTVQRDKVAWSAYQDTKQAVVVV